jgi:hypothetical protein
MLAGLFGTLMPVIRPSASQMSAFRTLSFVRCEQHHMGELMLGRLCTQDHWKASRREAQSRRAGSCRPTAASSGMCSTGQGRRHADQAAGHDRHCEPSGRGGVPVEGSPSSWRAVIDQCDLYTWRVSQCHRQYVRTVYMYIYVMVHKAVVLNVCTVNLWPDC